LDDATRRDELALMMRGTTSEAARHSVEEMLQQARNAKEKPLDQP
jgi:hypothetical protein